MLKVNGQPAEPGCYIAGHHGQYGIDMLADVCEQFDITFDKDDDPRHWRFHAESDDPDDLVHEVIPGLAIRTLDPEQCWERQMEAADRLDDLLNQHTEGGYWTWQDGEFFLVQTEVERWLFVQAADYEEAWEQVMEANVNEHCGYTDQYQAVELAEDSPDEKVYQFKITVEYESFNHEGQEVTERG